MTAFPLTFRAHQLHCSRGLRVPWAHRVRLLSWATGAPLDPHWSPTGTPLKPVKGDGGWSPELRAKG